MEKSDNPFWGSMKGERESWAEMRRLFKSRYQERCERLQEVITALSFQNEEIALQMSRGLDIDFCEVRF